MGANDGITGVGVGLGHKPNPYMFVFNGTGGTAVVHHDPRDYGNLMTLKGRTLQKWSAVYSADPAPQAATYSSRVFNLKTAGTTSVTFSRVRVLDVQHVAGAVEVTLQYGGAQKLPTGPAPPPVGPQASTETAHITKSLSNIKNN